LAWVSKPLSVSAHRDAGALAASCAAVATALPNAPAGRRREGLRACRRWREASTSRSTRRMCASAALRARPRRAQARVAQELLGIGERDRARAAPGERAHPADADHHAVGGERRRRRRRAKARASQPSSRYSSLFEAVSQISIERKCERFGSG
jgi:hypothetical protein